MTRYMRRLPTTIAAVFLFVQVYGLADYSTANMGGSALRGWLFALALEVGIFGAWYFTRQNVTTENKKDGKLSADQRKDIQARIGALVTALLLMVVSMGLNTAKSIIDIGPNPTPLVWWSALAYGLTPTLFSAVLGFLQGSIDRLPMPPQKPAANPLQMRIYAAGSALLALVETRISEASAKPAAQDGKPVPNATAKKYKCKRCNASKNAEGKPFETPQELAAHARHNCPKRKVTK